MRWQINFYVESKCVTISKATSFLDDLGIITGRLVSNHKQKNCIIYWCMSDIYHNKSALSLLVITILNEYSFEVLRCRHEISDNRLK